MTDESNARTTVTAMSFRAEVRDEAGRLVTYFIDMWPDGIRIQPISSESGKAPVAVLSYPAAYAAGLKESK